MDKPLWRPLVAASALLLIGATACSGDSDGGEDALADATNASSQEDGSSTGGGGDERGAGGRGSEPLGTTTGQGEASPSDDTLVPLRIDVTGLERNGDLVELYMTLTNESDDAEMVFEPWGQFGADTGGGSYDLAGVGLVDQAAQKMYLPVLDSEGRCLCTGDLINLVVQPGEPAELHASFGGVPEDVESLDLHVPGFDPISGLEVG